MGYKKLSAAYKSHRYFCYISRRNKQLNLNGQEVIEMKVLTIIALFVGALSASAIHAAPPLNHIVGNWHLDEGVGQLIFDSSGYNSHGQLGDDTGVDTADPLWISRRFDNAALNADGTQFTKVAHANHLEPKRISVEAWVRPTASDSDNLPVIVGKGEKDSSLAAYSLYLHIDSNGTLGVPFFYVAHNANGVLYNVESPDGAPSLLDGKWHHLVGTYDRKTVRLYVDGVEIGTGTPHTAPIPYASFSKKDLYIGGYPLGQTASLIGDIDDVKIWDKALTRAEVRSRYRGY